MNDRKGIIFDLQKNSLVDGPGIRTTVFFKGCNLKCAWCHNPESQSPEPQMMFYAHKCTGCGKCKEKCPNGLERCSLCGTCAFFCPHEAREICGKQYTAEEILKEIRKDKPFYETSSGGVTFSGGECMLQIDLLEHLLRECKKEGIHTAVDTAGHVPYSFFERILPYTDLFLYDVKCLNPEVHRTYTGVDNRLILENLGKLLKTHVPVRIRIPLIKGVNATVEEMKKIKDFLLSHGTPQGVDLLPYHPLGESKSLALGITPAVFQAPTKEETETLKEIFSHL